MTTLAAQSRPAPQPMQFNRDQYYRMGELGIFEGKRVELLWGVIYEKYPPNNAEPAPLKFTRDQYYLMYENGLFDGLRVELIDGEIIVMSPQNDPHASTVALINWYLTRRLPEGFILRPQLPLSAGRSNEPEPDFAILRGDPTIREGHHPATALLVIEVADSSLALDRRKAVTYASANIPEYWIVNINDDCIEVHRTPVNGQYTQKSVARLDDTVTPLSFPQLPIPVRALFPRA